MILAFYVTPRLVRLITMPYLGSGGDFSAEVFSPPELCRPNYGVQLVAKPDIYTSVRKFHSYMLESSVEHLIWERCKRVRYAYLIQACYKKKDATGKLVSIYGGALVPRSYDLCLFSNNSV